MIKNMACAAKYFQILVYLNGQRQTLFIKRAYQIGQKYCGRLNNTSPPPTTKIFML